MAMANDIIPPESRRGRKRRDLTPWLRRMAVIELEQCTGSTLKLAKMVVAEMGVGPCASENAIVSLLRERWRREYPRWLRAELAQRNLARIESIRAKYYEEAARREEEKTEYREARPSRRWWLPRGKKSKNAAPE